MKADEASSTAKVIAAATILLEHEKHDPSPVPHGAPELCEVFLSNSAAGRFLSGSTRSPFGRRCLRVLEKWTLPGIVDHYWRRKRWIEKHCREQAADGFQRIVVFGAGFDTLGIRLAREFNQLEVIELDHPSTQGVKTAALYRHRIRVPENLHFVPVDLSSPALTLPLPDDGRPVVCIMEGLLMYLEPAKIEELLGCIRRLGPDTRLIFTFMSRWPDGTSGFRPNSRLIDWWLSWRGEPFTWSMEPDAMRGFLESHGFHLLEIHRGCRTNGATSPKRDFLEGENLVFCQPLANKKPGSL